MGPDVEVQLYDACIVNGIRYHTISRDARRTTQNSGVSVPSSDDGENLDFFGVLKDVVQLFYSFRYKVQLFWCEWFQCNPKKKSIVEEFGLLSIDTSKTWYADDPFILANQANQVYYLNDIKCGGHWKVVQKVQHREIYEVTEVDEVYEDIESRNNFKIETNQDNSSNEATLVVGEELEISQLCRLDVEHQHINISNAQVELARDAQSFLNDEDEDTEIDGDTDDQLSLSDDSAMPPKRIEHLPVLETPIADSSSSGRPLRRETRGTHSHRLRRQISDRGRLPITFRQSDGHPIGPNAASFMTKLGLSVKKFAPLQAKSWKHIPAENKRMIYDRISAAFDISFQEGSSSVMKETDRLMSARYRDNRSKMHNHYKKLSHLPPAERRQHIPIEFCETQDDWNYMCDLFESEAFQTDQSQRKDRITVFNETHYSSKKGWIGDTAKTTYDDMVRLRDECILSQNPEDVIDVVQIADTVCDQVLGTRSGYIRGLGSGPKPVRSTSSDATSSSRSTNAVLRERLQSTQDELANTKIQLANTQDELASIKSRQDLFEQILNRLAPGALDSLIHNSSSTPPPPPPS
ncbi:hypothetical protein ZIOFF_071161 [Zingiber officinale]|uniref:DUF4216 domain-containing protein n=1 Tax=Zingiber officinale TaxID=94328 RepID=A0A8J5C9C1_ZINOF|nr:hypothetical protein ZIOFF_071161 [Zingiber officinale]